MYTAFSKSSPNSSSNSSSIWNSFLHRIVPFIIANASFTLKSLARRNFSRITWLLSSARSGTPQIETSSGETEAASTLASSSETLTVTTASSLASSSETLTATTLSSIAST
ncbi:hypothetical protein V8G54_009026, partial [Vigna mungo]